MVFLKHCYVSISYITICLLCRGDLFGKATDVGKLYSYPKQYSFCPSATFSFQFLHLIHQVTPLIICDLLPLSLLCVCSSLGIGYCI